MRVAIIIPRLAQLGPVTVIQALVNSLCEIEKLQIKVFYLDKNVDHHMKMMVPVEKLDRRTFRFEDYDIIHTNGIRPDLFAFINRKKIRYHVSTIHNLVFEDLKFTYNRIISLLFGNLWLLLWKRADKLVCVSKSMKSYYEKWYDSSKLEVIYNGIAEPDNSVETENDVIEAMDRFKSGGLKVIGSAGIFTKGKGFDLILYFLAEEKEFAFVIFGDGEKLSALRHLAKKLAISDRIYFCGFRSNAVNYFRYFDFFIMPSRSEGFGLALIEAVQQKVPIICSDIDVFKELLNTDEVTFFILDNKDSLISALRIAMDTGKMKTELAYSRYKKEYTDQLMAIKYYELFKSA